MLGVRKVGGCRKALFLVNLIVAGQMLWTGGPAAAAAKPIVSHIGGDFGNQNESANAYSGITANSQSLTVLKPGTIVTIQCQVWSEHLYDFNPMWFKLTAPVAGYVSTSLVSGGVPYLPTAGIPDCKPADLKTIVPASPPSYRVGEGSDFEAGYEIADQAAGGVNQLGKPIDAVHVWGNGCIQDFEGGLAGKSALMSPGCGPAIYTVTGPEWQYLEGNFGGRAAAVVGYPNNNRHLWGAAWAQDFSGGQRGWNILLSEDGASESYDVLGELLHKYIDLGGAAGLLDVPTSDQYPWQGGWRQDFAGGSLGWSLADGAYQIGTLPGVGAGSREQRAIGWAQSQIGQQYQPDGKPWNGWCDRFVANAYGMANSGYYTAIGQFQNLQARGLIHGDHNPPPGALVFFTGVPGLGHVMLSLGNGQFISTGLVIFQTNWNMPGIGSYLGWSWANPEWPGR